MQYITCLYNLTLQEELWGGEYVSHLWRLNNATCYKVFSKCEMNVTVLQIFHSFQCNKILLIVKSLILDSFPYQGRQGKSGWPLIIL